MAMIYIFACSGVALSVLIVGKMVEARISRQIFILQAISKGDAHARRIRNTLLHYYVEKREWTYYFFTKQLPMRGRNLWNKVTAIAREKFEKYIGDIRNSRLLKRSDGLSEFFKSLSDKDSGRIDDIFHDSQNGKKEVD